MKKFVKYGLVLGFAVVLTGCEKKEKEPVVVEPPVVEETQSAIKRTLETAKEKAANLKETAGEKASDLKETAGDAIDKATETVKDFGSRAGDILKKTTNENE